MRSFLTRLSVMKTKSLVCSARCWLLRHLQFNPNFDEPTARVLDNLNFRVQEVLLEVFTNYKNLKASLIRGPPLFY